MTTARLTAIVVVPTPPFGEKTVDEPPGRVGGALEDRDRSDLARALEADEQRLDPRLELARVERLGHDVVRAGLEEPDPVLDVVGLADAQDGDRRQGRRAPDLAADLGRGLRPADDVDDDELVVAGRGEDLGAVLDRGDCVPDAAEDAGDDAAGRRVRFEEQEATGRHRDSAAGHWERAHERGRRVGTRPTLRGYNGRSVRAARPPFPGVGEGRDRLPGLSFRLRTTRSPSASATQRGIPTGRSRAHACAVMN